MTGVTYALTRDQAHALRRYVKPQALDGRSDRSPNKNLIRRGLLEPVGDGRYRTTPFGLDLLERGEA